MKFRGLEPQGYLEREEARAIIRAIPDVSLHPERDSLLVEALWQTGGRVTEVLCLMPEQIGLSSMGLVNLKQHSDKVPFKEVEVSQALCERLKAYCRSQGIREGEYVFRPNRRKQGHLSRWHTWWIVGKAARAAGVFKLNRFGKFKSAWPHLFRHGNAMLLLDEVGDLTLIRQQLGHSSLLTTQGYLSVRRPKLKKKVSEIQW